MRARTWWQPLRVATNMVTKGMVTKGTDLVAVVEDRNKHIEEIDDHRELEPAKAAAPNILR